MGTIEVLINGVQYLPMEDEVGLGQAHPEFDAYDCDGTGLNVGDQVYIRQSALSTYNLSHSKRNGTFWRVKDDALCVKFGDGFTVGFPSDHVRKAK